MAAASVAVATPFMMQIRMMKITPKPGSDAINVRSTAAHPGNFSSMVLPSARRG